MNFSELGGVTTLGSSTPGRCPTHPPPDAAADTGCLRVRGGVSKRAPHVCEGEYIRCVERAHVTSTNRTHSQHFSNMGAPMGSFVPPAASESTGGSICRSPSLYCSWQRVSALLKDASVSAWICSAKSKMGRLFCHNKFGDNHITT